jgi:hypothetical protein
MDAPYYNGGPDDYPFRRLNRGERTYGKGRCRRCANPIIVPVEVEGYGTVCSWVCVMLVAEQQERKVG